MDLGLKGKTALVTGASAGIGRAIAKILAAEGVRLCVAARRRELLVEVGKEIVGAGGSQPHIAVADLVQKSAPDNLVAEAVSALGQVDILINCAGVGRPMSMDMPDEEWQEAMTISFTQVRRLMLAVIPHMIKHKWGRIINITGKSEVDGLLSATAPKAAVHALSKPLASQVGKHGITINSLAPGRIMSEQIRRKYSPEFRAEHAAKEIPVGRYGEPEELANLAAFLVSPLASYITGVVIPVDGGLRKYPF